MFRLFKSLFQFFFPQPLYFVATQSNGFISRPTLDEPILASSTKPLTSQSDFNLPDDMIGEILRKLPPSYFIGDKALQTVSKKFNENGKKLIQQKSIIKSVRELINSCKNEADALYILKNQSLRKQLRFFELLQIAGFVKEITHALLKERNLSEWELVNLGSRSQAAAQAILASPKHYQKISDFGLLNLSKNNPFIALQILTTSSLGGNFRPNDLIILGKYHLTAAWHILRTPALYKKLNSLCLAYLGQHHEEIALYILKTPELCQNLSSDDLTLLGEVHKSIAAYILNTPELDNKVHSLKIYRFGNHFEKEESSVFSAKKIFERYKTEYAKTHDLKMSLSSWLNSGLAYQPLCKHLLDTPALCEQLDSNMLFSIGQTHPQLAIAILKTPRLVKKLLEMIHTLGEKNQLVAEHIFKTQELYDLLSNAQIVKIAQKYESVRDNILNSPQLLDKLSQEDILALSKPKHRLRELINNPELLLDNQFSTQYLDICSDYPITAKYILDTTTLCTHLKEKDKKILQDKLGVFDAMMNIIESQGVRDEKGAKNGL